MALNRSPKFASSLCGHQRNTISSSIEQLLDSQRDVAGRERMLLAFSPNIGVIPSSAERKICWSASETIQTGNLGSKVAASGSGRQRNTIERRAENLRATSERLAKKIKVTGIV